MTPTLSVVIPVYEDAYRLSFVLEALVRQQSPNYQILLVDGGVRLVEDLISEFASRLTLEYCPLPKPAPSNPGLTRNYGIVRAKAPRILFLDQDCVPAANVLAEHAQYKDDPIVVAGFRTFIHQDDLPKLTLDKLYNEGTFYYAADMRYIWFKDQVKLLAGWKLFYFDGSVYSAQMSAPTVLLRKLGGFDETNITWGSDDIELGVRLGRAGCFVTLRPDLVVYHLDHALRPRKRQLLWGKVEPTLNTTKMRLTEPLLRVDDHREEALHSWGEGHEGLAVITVITNSGGYADFFLQSCERHRIKPIVLGQGSQWRGFGTKVNLIYYYLKQIETPPFVLFVDGFDSVFQSSLQEIWQSYRAFGSPIVFSSDVLCWPDESLENKFPHSPTVFRYLNAGGFIGETKTILLMLEQMGYPSDVETVNEQDLMSHYFLSHQSEVRLDYETRIFHPLHHSESTARFLPQAGYFVNTQFGYRPHVLHLNGQVDADSYAQNLGYKITSYKRNPYHPSGIGED